MPCILTLRLEILYVKWQFLVLLLQYSKRRFTVGILYVQYQVNIISTVLQETFYRVPDLYTDVVNMSRDLKVIATEVHFIG